jgi:glycine oxidase
MSTDSVHPILIVGQGLAGSLLGFHLLQAGCPIRMMDAGYAHTASQVAAGLINPITGRRFVKSWRIDELLPYAMETYRAMEKFLGIELYHERPILRSLHNRQDEDAWHYRLDDPAYQEYLLPMADAGNYRDRIQFPHSLGEVQGSAQTDLPGLVLGMRAYLKTQGWFQQELFDYNALQPSTDGAIYKGHYYRAVVFCEGYRGKDNPFFPELPFGGNKGEVLRVHIDGPVFEKILKHQVFVVPMPQGDYWIGAQYAWNYTTEAPTEAARIWLQERLDAFLLEPYQVLRQEAALRPTVIDRRPLLGLHREWPSLGIFNGLGTKGASLGPFFARQMSQLLLQGELPDPEVSIYRFPVT